MRRRADPLKPDYQQNIAAYSEADRMYDEGRFHEALRGFQSSLAADPSDGDALHAIGSCYDALEEPARAAAAYRKELELLPAERHPELHFNIGNALFDLGLYQDAMAEYRLVPEASSVWPKTLINMTLASKRLGHGG